MLTTEQEEHISAYVENLLEILNLSEWVVILDSETTEENDKRKGEEREEQPELLNGPISAIASMTCLDGRFCAVLRVSERWSGMSLAIQRETLVHEVLHLVHNDMAGIAYRGIVGNGKGTARNEFWDHFRDEEERAVDRLSGALVDMMPEWPPSEPAKWIRVRRPEEWF